jgi:hypothetical protein
MELRTETLNKWIDRLKNMYGEWLLEQAKHGYESGSFFGL